MGSTTCSTRQLSKKLFSAGGFVKAAGGLGQSEFSVKKPTTAPTPQSVRMEEEEAGERHFIGFDFSTQQVGKGASPSSANVLLWSDNMFNVSR